MNIIEGDIIAKESKIAIIVSRFNRFINNNLLEGAIDVLKRVGYVKDENITVVWVPGAYELPLAARALVDRNQFDALIALGTIIRGITMHFELIARECSCRLSKIAIMNSIPIGFGILTTDDIGQAIERAGIKENNKGSESALAVLEMINVLKILNE